MSQHNKFSPQEWYFERTKRNHFWVGRNRGQEKISNLVIGIAGLGGMGSHIAELLVRAGVRNLRISDPDDISVSNINRQVIANTETLGQFKRDALEAELKKIAPETQIRSYAGVTKENVEEFVEGCHAIVDEIDVFPLPEHLYLHRSARKRNLPIYSAYVVGMGTHVYKFQGDKFRIEDMLGSENPESLARPTAEFLLATFGYPLPSYLRGEREKQYLEQIATGDIPIFGPATLLGQSLLVTRLLKDALGPEHIDFGQPTPVMPQFLSLDPIDFTLKVETFRKG